MKLGWLKSKLASSSIIYTLTHFFNAALPFLLLPVLTKYLTTEEYGVVSMFTVLTGIINPLIGFGVSGAVARAYYREEISDFASYISNCMFLMLVSFAAISITFLLCKTFISNVSSIPENWLWAALVTSLANFVFELQLSIYRVKFMVYQYAFLKGAQTIINFGIVAVLIISLHYTWDGFIVGKVISTTVFALAGLVYMVRRKFLVLRYNPSYVKHALSFGVPLIPHTLSGFILSMSDRLFITNMVGLSSTGSYAVAYQVGSVISLLVTSFNAAWSPWLYDKLKKNDDSYRVKLVKLSYGYFIVLLLVCLAFIVVVPIVVDLFIADGFNVPLSVITWVVVGFFFQGCYMMVVNYLFYFGRTKSIASVTFSVAFLNIVLNYFFIKWWGVLGAAIATSVAFFVKFVSIWILSNSIYQLPWFDFSHNRRIQ